MLPVASGNVISSVRVPRQCKQIDVRNRVRFLCDGDLPVAGEATDAAVEVVFQFSLLTISQLVPTTAELHLRGIFISAGGDCHTVVQKRRAAGVERHAKQVEYCR